MREVFAAAADWLERERPFALVTLVELRDARTAPLGTTIAVALDGRIVGNIGAGCHEATIVQIARRTASDGTMRPIEIDLEADDLGGGTACGATMRLIAWRPDVTFREDALAIATGERAVQLTVGEFDHVVAPKAVLILVGATALAQEVAVVARLAGFHVTVVDPRSAFATPERLRDAHTILHGWPEDALPGILDATSAIVILSHDAKLDLPALRCALRSDAWYVGLLGSRRTQASRREVLRDEGFAAAALERIRGPVGLDIGAVTGAEIAISILAEMVGVRNGRFGASLSALTSEIH
jgi:xanthine dehydrogenase accessory factor